jgi:hypothetical protein
MASHRPPAAVQVAGKHKLVRQRQAANVHLPLSVCLPSGEHMSLQGLLLFTEMCTEASAEGDMPPGCTEII